MDRTSCQYKAYYLLFLIAVDETLLTGLAFLSSLSHKGLSALRKVIHTFYRFILLLIYINFRSDKTVW